MMIIQILTKITAKHLGLAILSGNSNEYLFLFLHFHFMNIARVWDLL